MYSPFTIRQESFQSAWIEAVKILYENSWELRNLTVQIQNPCILDTEMNQRLFAFARNNDILTPKQVAYTIFPHGLYQSYESADDLFFAYNRPNGFFERIKSRHRVGWGTYFKRMTFYERDNTSINQLETIIDAINTRDKVHKATYTIIIQRPKGETTAPRGGPCLNFLVVQLEPTHQQKTLGLLCLYRNQDFLTRAYGNYWGLCNLLNFLARETNSLPGPLTCLASHAYVEGKKLKLINFVNELS